MSVPLAGDAALIGAARFFSELRRAAHALHPNERLKRLKFMLRAIVQGSATRRWLRKLRSPPLASIVAATPHLYEKLQRPYLHRHVSLGERLALLHHHYRYLDATLGPELSSRLHRRDPCLIGTLQHARRPVGIYIASERQYEKEGELTLSLARPGEPRLMSTTFTLGPAAQGGAMVLIGCVQGPSSVHALDLLRDATRDLHGLRPGSAIVQVLQLLGRRLGVERIRAVPDSAHIYRHPRYWLRGKRFHRSYDGMWSEAGGERSRDGWWDLPLIAHRRELQEVAANKRALYRRRYEMLDDLAAQFASLQ